MDDVRRMIPKRLDDLPEWEVSRDGRIIGWVRQKRVGRSVSTFFEAIGIHPVTGERVRLELSTDFDERVAAISQLQDDPEATRGVHWS